ncbi:hypothetical protein [Falsiroseomonas sp. HW251]|uniref:hypothetical protein n=1 Tax=Falsiroseomonas sp. HW251 TaxID=3390998 RepID=UPI003D320797
MGYLSNIARSEGDPKILRSGPSSRGNADELARALGWFSIGLGLAELFAPRQFTRALGMEGSETLVRSYGLREIGHGILSLSPDKTTGLWSRVGGDALDILTLATAYRPDNPKRDNVGLALAAVAGITLLDVVGAQAVTSRHRRTGGDRQRYRDRSGFPQGARNARGAARKDFRTPPDMQAAPALAAVSRVGDDATSTA